MQRTDRKSCKLHETLILGRPKGTNQRVGRDVPGGGGDGGIWNGGRLDLERGLAGFEEVAHGGVVLDGLSIRGDATRSPRQIYSAGPTWACALRRAAAVAATHAQSRRAIGDRLILSDNSMTEVCDAERQAAAVSACRPLDRAAVEYKKQLGLYNLMVQIRESAPSHPAGCFPAKLLHRPSMYTPAFTGSWSTARRQCRRGVRSR